MTDTFNIPNHIFAQRPRSVYKSLGVPIYVCAPDYRQSSGGIRVMHYFCHILNELGEEAYLINARTVSPRLRTPQLTFERMREHFLSGRNPVTVYPEVVHNNPFNTPLIARWLLNVPGHLGKPVDFETKDIIFYYEPWCLPPHLNGHFLHIDPLDHSIFNNEDNPHDSQRTLECFYANKYFLQKQAIFKEHHNLTSLGQEIRRSPQEIASILRQAKVLYCYEPSGIINEAQACGCPVLLVRSNYWKLPPDDSHHELPGVAVYGEDGALERAREGLARVRSNHTLLRDNSWLTARSFIETIYAAQEDFLCNGKPILNSAQDLWKTSIEEREAVVERFDQIYSRSHLLLKSNEPSKTTRPPFIYRYREFLRKSFPQEFEVQLLAERMVQMQAPPVIHLLMPCRAADAPHLAASLDSLNKQFYPHWKVTVVSDHPPPEGWVEAAKTQWLALKDAIHIDYVIDEMAAASGGDWIAVLRPGVTLAPEALLLMADAIKLHPEWRLLYTDEDQIEEDGRHVSPRFKPGFNLELLRSCNYLGTMVLVRKDAFMDAGRFGSHQGAHTYDLALRMADRLRPSAFGRLSRMVVHAPADAQPNAATEEAEARALAEHLSRRGQRATIRSGLQAGTRHIEYLGAREASVSIVLAVTDELDLVRRFLTDAQALTVQDVRVFDVGGDPDMRKLLDDLAATPEWSGRLQVHTATASNWPSLAAELAQGNLLYMTSPYAAAPTPQQLAELLGTMQRAGVAAVSPRLVLPGQTQATVVNAEWTYKAGIKDADESSLPDTPGPLGLNLCAHEKLAVNRLPLLVDKAVYQALNGFDLAAMNLGDAVVDFCLRLARGGHTLIWTPHATLHCHAEPTTPAEESRQHLLERHVRELAADACLHPMWSWDNPGQFEHHIPLSWTDGPSHRPRILILATDGEPANDNVFYDTAMRWQDAAQVQLVVVDMRVQELSALTVAKLMPDAIVLHASKSPTLQKLLQETRRCLPEIPVIARIDSLDFLQRRQGQTEWECRPALRAVLHHASRVITRTPELARLCDGLSGHVCSKPLSESMTAMEWLGH